MLSSMILEHKNDPQYADYIGQKFQNYMLMKNFALNHDSCFFAINPGNISSQDYTVKLEHFDRICSKEQQDLNGKVWKLDSLEVDDITPKLG